MATAEYHRKWRRTSPAWEKQKERNRERYKEISGTPEYKQKRHEYYINVEKPQREAKRMKKNKCSGVEFCGIKPFNE